MSEIDEIVSAFEHKQLAIDYTNASGEQMIDLEKVLNERTDKRPHDDLSFAEHMMEYKDDFCYLVCDDHFVSSYKMHVKNCRPRIVTIFDVLSIAGEDGQYVGISESEFESVF